jgi:hypothetical protein
MVASSGPRPRTRCGGLFCDSSRVSIRVQD